MRIALTQHNVRSCGYGDVIKDLNSDPNIIYDVFYVTPATQYQEEPGWDRYGLNLFLISRLENIDGDNMLQVHSITKEVLDNIIKIFCEKFDVDTYGTSYVSHFQQKYQDLLAGTYITVTFEIPTTLCIDE